MSKLVIRLTVVSFAALLLLGAQKALGKTLALKAMPDYGNAQIILSPLNKDKQLYLIKIIGVDGIQERVMVTKQNRPSRGDYDYSPHGFKGFRLYDRKRSKTLVKGTVTKVYDFYIAGQRDPIKLIADAETMKTMQSNPLKKEFLDSEFLSEKKIPESEVKVHVAKFQSDFNQKCGGKINVEFSTKNTKLKLRGVKAANALVELCEDEDYKDEIKKYKKVSVGQAKGDDIKVSKPSSTSIVIKTSMNQFNSIDTAKLWLADNL